MELRHVPVAAASAAADASFGTVARPGSPGGARQAPPARRGRQQDRRRRPGRRLRPDRRRRPESRPQRDAGLAADLQPDREEAGHPVLPVPPTDAEKYSYVRRHTWVLTLCAALSFPPLVYSQVRMVIELALVPALRAVRAVRRLELPALAARGRHEPRLRPGRAQADRGRLAAAVVPVGRRVPAGVRRAGRGAPQRLDPRRRVARHQYPGRRHAVRPRRLGQPELKAMARRFGFAYADPPGPGLVQEVGQPASTGSTSPTATTSCCSTPTSRRGPTCSTRRCPTSTLFPDVGIVQTPQFFHVVDEQTWVERGAGRDPGAVLPVHPDRSGPQGRRDLRRAAARSTGGRRSSQNGGMSLARALGGPAHRLRPVPAGLAAALPADRAVDRELPGQRDGVHQPAVPLVLRHDEPAGQAGSSGRPSCRCTAGSATWPGWPATSTPRVFTFVAPAAGDRHAGCSPPAFLLLKNLIFFAPMLFYAGVIYPMWHRSPYRLEAWSVRVLSGWAHMFALWDMMQRQAARLAALGQRRDQGRTAAAGSGSALDRLVARHGGGVDRAGGVADDDDGPLQLLPHLRARRVPARRGRAHPASAAKPGPAREAGQPRRRRSRPSPPRRWRVALLARLAVIAPHRRASPAPGERPPRRAAPAAARAAASPPELPPARLGAALTPPDGKFFGIEAHGSPDSLAPVTEVAAPGRPQTEPARAVRRPGARSFDAGRGRAGAVYGALYYMAWEPFGTTAASIADGESDGYITSVRQVRWPRSTGRSRSASGTR